ncbi:MAG: MBL fold metallo-hydrolase [Eubacteriales bacterium]|jgi:ribonuclease BN (tRNA processing enzyme)
MRITIIGSSHGVPEPKRKCACTMIQVGGNTYFIDMGCQAIEELINRGIPVESVKAVFVTHMHGDHTNGLISFFDLCNWYFRAADPLILLPEEKGLDAMFGWIEANGTDLRGIRTGVINEGITYYDGTIKVTAVRTKHSAVSFSYIVEAEEKRVLFTGDLRGPDVDFPELAKEKHMDLMICESAHFSPLKYIPVFEEAKAGKVIINHYSMTWMTDLLKLKAEMHPYNIWLATDDLEIEL